MLLIIIQEIQNILTGNYEKAIENYKNALKSFVPNRKECDIRVNYALSICKLVEVDEEDTESIEKAISQYEGAIDVLVEEKCAHRNNNKRT